MRMALFLFSRIFPWLTEQILAAQRDKIDKLVALFHPHHSGSLQFAGEILPPLVLQASLF